MPQTRRGAHPRPSFYVVALTVVALVALSGVSPTISARSPSTPSPIPPEALRPVVVPSRLPEPSPRMSPSPSPSGSHSPSLTPEPTAPAGPEHVVRAGDTLWQIATWHRTGLELILRWNPDIDPRRLVAGQRIPVPGGGPMATLAPNVEPRLASTDHLWPLPVHGTITTGFSSAHRGIDIAAPAGTAVRAIASGTVTWAGWKDTGGGYVVIIRHPDGMVSTYNHNRKLTVRAGQVVARGDQIAEVGSTGWSTGPHLDLRITMGGEFVDPPGLEWTP